MTGNRKRGFWHDAWHRFKRERLAMVCLSVVLIYGLIAILSKVGVIATPWDAAVGPQYSPPSAEDMKLWMGTDIFGRSVFYKMIHGARVAMSVGLISVLVSVPVGVVLGAVSGYYGGWVDEVVVWLINVISAVPYMMLLVAITFVLGKGLSSVYIALGATSWIGLTRVIRGEVMKHKSREYVVAAEALGASNFQRIFKHILPNVSHFIIIDISLQFMGAIKAEVILSFLGIGVQGQPSWGIMIDDAKMELARGVWWQLSAATIAMFVVVLAFNILGDGLRDALDPKIK